MKCFLFHSYKETEITLLFPTVYCIVVGNPLCVHYLYVQRVADSNGHKVAENAQ